jgi:hypothetical protein
LPRVVELFLSKLIKNMPFEEEWMKTKTLVVLALSASYAFAQSPEQVLNSDPINVDGYLAEERPVTDS